METNQVGELPTSVKAAKAAGSRHYFTGLPCSRGHVSPRLTVNRKCLECSKGHCKTHYYKNPDVARARVRKWYRDNQPRVVKRMAEWREANRETSRRASLAWSRNNPVRVLANFNARRARLLHACPAWVNKEDLSKIYEKRKQLSIDTGAVYHVDHIIPLRGKDVCGLHVPWNLQIVPASVNLRKGNRLDAELLEGLWQSTTT